MSNGTKIFDCELIVLLVKESAVTFDRIEFEKDQKGPQMLSSQGQNRSEWVYFINSFHSLFSIHRPRRIYTTGWMEKQWSFRIIICFHTTYSPWLNWSIDQAWISRSKGWITSAKRRLISIESKLIDMYVQSKLLYDD